jgi:urease accessory protein
VIDSAAPLSDRASTDMTAAMRRIAPLLLLPALAMAHEGHDHGLAAGFAHPWLGWDHLAAMVAVGLLAARHGGRWAVAAPAGFVLALAGGAALGHAGLALPGQEHLVAASVIALGALLAVAAPLAWALPAVAVAGLLHGLAHGGELAADGSTLAGIVLASAVLHGLGAGAGLAARHAAPAWHRWAGGAVAAAGAVLVVLA